VYAINGVTGKVLDKWPIKTGHPILSNILVTKVSNTRKDLDMVRYMYVYCLRIECSQVAILPLK
jgi:hypothetical protein